MGPFAPTVPLTSFHCVPIVTVPVVHSLNNSEVNRVNVNKGRERRESAHRTFPSFVHFSLSLHPSLTFSPLFANEGNEGRTVGESKSEGSEMNKREWTYQWTQPHSPSLHLVRWVHVVPFIHFVHSLNIRRKKRNKVKRFLALTFSQFKLVHSLVVRSPNLKWAKRRVKWTMENGGVVSCRSSRSLSPTSCSHCNTSLSIVNIKREHQQQGAVTEWKWVVGGGRTAEQRKGKETNQENRVNARLGSFSPIIHSSVRSWWFVSLLLILWERESWTNKGEKQDERTTGGKGQWMEPNERNGPKSMIHLARVSVSPLLLPFTPPRSSSFHSVHLILGVKWKNQREWARHERMKRWERTERTVQSFHLVHSCSLLHLRSTTVPSYPSPNNWVRGTNEIMWLGEGNEGRSEENTGPWNPSSF